MIRGHVEQVNVMKVDKKPTESYADVGGLEDQIRASMSPPAYPYLDYASFLVMARF